MPPSIRLFVTPSLAPGVSVEATPGQAHYLGRVMRLARGDAVRLFNGRDGEWTARIERLDRREGSLAVIRQVRPQQCEPDLWLLFAPLRRDLTELVVEKATELGAAVILPVVTERTSPARPSEQRLATIATEAAEQCERLSVPRIAAPAALLEVLAGWPAGRALVVAVERADAPPMPVLNAPAALLIGPEGGFTAAELDAVLAAAFVVAASLGPRILRAETAAIVGLALLQAELRAHAAG